jgi:hypothetical protein
LSRQEAFDLVKRATRALVSGDDAALSSDVRKKAREILGRDSESLGERYFHRILRDAHDVEAIDLRRRGDDYEVSLPSSAAPVAEQLKAAEVASTPAPAASTGPAPARGMGHRALPQRRGPGVGGRPAAPPPELLMVGVVSHVGPKADAEVIPKDTAVAPAVSKPKGKGRGRGKGKSAAVAPEVAAKRKKAPPAAESAAPKKPARGRAADGASDGAGRTPRPRAPKPAVLTNA